MSSTQTKPKGRVSIDERWKQVVLAHGGGGQLTDQLLNDAVLPKLGNVALNDLLDCGLMDAAGRQLALTTDSYVVQPLTFPGGDIGRLAISGTVNDLAVCGAEPLGIALSFILAEGLERSVLETVVESIAATAREAGVNIVTGDTKVVAHGQADGIYITTSGVGLTRSDRQIHPRRIKPGDRIIINGPIADHGLAVMLAREMPDVASSLKSDVAPLNKLVKGVLDKTDCVMFMRDPTRGGLAGLCADLAQRTGFHIVLNESEIPVRAETRHAAEMLGLDPIEVANEGKVVMVVRPQGVEDVLAALASHPLGQAAKVIGEVVASYDGMCEMKTSIGGRRIIQKPYGEQLPRIC